MVYGLLLSIQQHTFAAQESIPKLLFTACTAQYETVQNAVNRVNTEQSTSAYDAYQRAKQTYLLCHQTQHDIAADLFDAWSEAINTNALPQAYALYQQAFALLVYDARGVEQALVSLLLRQAQDAYERGSYAQTTAFLDATEQYTITDDARFTLYYLRGVLAAAKQDFVVAKQRWDKALLLANTDARRMMVERFLQYILNRAQAPTNDPLSFRQHWLEWLHIDRAWKKLPPASPVIVAVIDNGVDLSHPDLSGALWSNTDEIPNNHIDDDDNGYVDDHDGYNFYAQTSVMPTNPGHGTQVAGLIGAQANNALGIAGIVPNARIMPLAVCAGKDCLSSQLLDAPIRYAVDQWAKVINMSLVAKHTTFTPALTDAIRYAHDHGVTVVMAAGNGMGTGEEKVGVDTSVTPLSPLCNERWAQDSIGVGAASVSWKLLPRSNYGHCVDILTYGENVLTTTSTEDLSGVYAFTEWTSFAAPLIAWVAALGYTAYSQATPDAIYEAMLASSTAGAHPQADLFLDILGALQPSAKQQTKVVVIAQTINGILLRQSAVKRWQMRKSLFTALDSYATLFRTKQDREKLRLLIPLRDELRMLVIE